MITPIVTSLSREVIVTVPAIDKEGGYALGATRWEMIRGAVWPHSKGRPSWVPYCSGGGAAFTLIVIAFALMIAARFVTARFTRYPGKGCHGSVRAEFHR